VFACGTKLGHLLAVAGGRVRSFAPTPYHTHNARPFDGGILLNHTRTDRVCLLDRACGVREEYRIPRYDEARLERVQEETTARQGFGRGLAAVTGELLAGGSSPATISLYRRGRPEPIASVNLTMDVRNAIHGLEVWPFDGAAP
jgi:hypothetical protein